MCIAPQLSNCRHTGMSELLKGVSSYSTRGGTSSCTVRVTNPSCSSSRSCNVSILSVMFGMILLSSPKRFLPELKRVIIGSFQRPPMSCTAYVRLQSERNFRLMLFVVFSFLFVITHKIVCTYNGLLYIAKLWCVGNFTINPITSENGKNKSRHYRR